VSRVEICWFPVDVFNTRWIPRSFSCGQHWFSHEDDMWSLSKPHDLNYLDVTNSHQKAYPVWCSEDKCRTDTHIWFANEHDVWSLSECHELHNITNSIILTSRTLITYHVLSAIPKRSDKQTMTFDFQVNMRSLSKCHELHHMNITNSHHMSCVVLRREVSNRQWHLIFASTRYVFVT